MQNHTLGAMESRFADLIWDHAPLATNELIRLCEQEFEWKRTTTYTMLKRLAERKLFKNEHGVVTALMSKEEFRGLQSEQFVEETFGGSLPQFLVAFSKRKKLTKKEIEELENLLKKNKEK